MQEDCFILLHGFMRHCHGKWYFYAYNEPDISFFQTTRDEHLMLGVLVLVVLDIIILVCWSMLHPVVCETRPLYATYNVSY